MAENGTTGKTGNAMMDSRKAKAYLLGEATWKVIIILDLGLMAWQIKNGQTPSMGLIWFGMVIAIVAGFMEAGYIGSQAWIDRYTGTVKDVAKTVADAVTKKDGDGG